MCGIVGYIGNKNAYPVLIKGLKRLEYRGYDSAGVALLQDGKINIYKKKGKVSELEAHCENLNTFSNVGIAHTRWATHGEPNDINAHPHHSMNGLFTIIHNGIIENYEPIKRELLNKGFSFYGETDTEVLVNFIEYIYNTSEEIDAEQAVRIALQKVVGAYGLVVLCAEEPDQIIAARMSSPMAIGIGEGEYIIASDATPIVEYTNNIVYLNDNDLAIIKNDCFTLKSTQHSKEITPKIQQIELSVDALEKDGFDHFMLKEIFEQPKTIYDSFRGRIHPETKEVFLGGLNEVMPQILAAKRIIIIACGTSWHAALIGEYLIEEYAQVPVEVEYASEYRYRKPIIFKDDVVLAISQSGETADTMAAIRLAKEKGALVLGICNVVGSSFSARNPCRGIYPCRSGNWCGLDQSIYGTVNGDYLDSSPFGLKKQNYSARSLLEDCRRFTKYTKKDRRHSCTKGNHQNLGSKICECQQCAVFRTWVFIPCSFRRRLKTERDLLHSCRRLCRR